MSQFNVGSPVVLVDDFLPGPVTFVGDSLFSAPVQIAVPGPQGKSGIDNAMLVQHVNADEPHPAYDDMASLTLIFENGLI